MGNTRSFDSKDDTYFTKTVSDSVLPPEEEDWKHFYDIPKTDIGWMIWDNQCEYFLYSEYLVKGQLVKIIKVDIPPHTTSEDVEYNWWLEYSTSIAESLDLLIEKTKYYKKSKKKIATIILDILEYYKKLRKMETLYQYKNKPVLFIRKNAHQNGKGFLYLPKREQRLETINFLIHGELEI